MNTRQRMRYSNTLIVKELRKFGADHIWLKKHFDPRKKYGRDIFYRNDGTFYTGLDLFNLADGMCFINGIPTLFQNKTNSWAEEKPIREFIVKNKITFLVFNVRKVKNSWQVFKRVYLPEGIFLEI